MITRPPTGTPQSGPVSDFPFRGLAVALVTPLTAHDEVDHEALARHAAWVVEGGVDVLMPCGTTGEGATLTEEEQRGVVATCLEAVGDRVPVVAGAAANATAAACRLVRGARAEGAHGILSVTPYYNKPSQEGLFRHFSEVAAAGEGLPLILYNVPGRTSVNLAPETVLRLAELEAVAGIKESSGNVGQVMTLLRDRPPGFGVLAGDDDLALALVALGADGLVSVAANEVPGPVAELIRAALEGRLVEARAIHYRLLPLFRANFVDTNPVPVKAALELMGRMSAHLRLPLTPLAEEGETVLRQALALAGALDGTDHDE